MLKPYSEELINDYVDKFISSPFTLEGSCTENGCRSCCIKVHFRYEKQYVWVDIDLSTLEWSFNKRIFDPYSIFDSIMEKAFKQQEFISKITRFLKENNCFVNESV